MIKLTKEIKEKIDKFFDDISPDELIKYVEDNYGTNVLIDHETPYCKVCGACGEDGCCTALVCKHHRDGEYCDTYLKELQFGYAMYRDTHHLLGENEVKDVFDKNYDKYLK